MVIFLEDNGIDHLIVEDLTGLFSVPQYFHNNNGQYICYIYSYILKNVLVC